MAPRPGRRRLRVILLGALCVAGCAPEATNWVRVEPSVAAPDFTLTQLQTGQPVRLSELRGRIVLMELWATWCGPCRFSTPSMDAIYRRYRERGVVALLVNEGEPAETVRKWVGRRFAAPVLLDLEGRVGRLYGVQGIPRLFVIDQQGRILYDRSGYRGGLERDLTAILNELLAGGPSAS